MILVQVLLPLVAILWLALRRPTLVWDLGLWAMVGVVLLLAVRLTGIWIYLPLRIPLALAGLLVAATMYAAWRLRTRWHSSARSWWRWFERGVGLRPATVCRSGSPGDASPGTTS
jgi:hypothetical protein